jgi:expansin (peptidoglycan-binding protein)
MLTSSQIVDRCNECNKGHLDLFEDAFAAVGGTSGLVQTSWRSISCDITSPLVLRNKEGKSLIALSTYPTQCPPVKYMLCADD